MLAGELALAGVAAVIVERRTTQEVEGSRAGGLLPRAIEVLDQRGIADRFIAEGQLYQSHGFANIRFDISDLPTRHAYVLGLWQRRIERILAAWVDELRIPILRGREVVGFAQDDTGVDVEVSDGTVVRAQHLVGCDGGRSSVRRAAGIDFTGWDASTSWMIAQVEMDGEPELGFRTDGTGRHALGRRSPEEPVGVVLMERELEHEEAPTLEELRAALVSIYGTDFGLRKARWISRFTDVSRQAASYRAGRVLLAGDAAHIHPPHGGQGLGTGVQDAVNLGWKLAQVVHGTSPETLLDTYHDERHPVAARVLHNTMAQVALSGSDPRHEALRDTVTELLRMDEPRHHVAAMLCGLDICYGPGEGHPLVGRRLPDLDLNTAGGETRAYAMLHDARPVLLDLGGPNSSDLPTPSDRIRVVKATYDGAWDLPVIGEVPAPAAVLVRPDGHVAWAGEVGDPALAEALATWFGAAIAV